MQWVRYSFVLVDRCFASLQLFIWHLMSVTVSHCFSWVKALPEGRLTDYTVGILAFDDSSAAFCVALVLTVLAAALSGL